MSGPTNWAAIAMFAGFVLLTALASPLATRFAGTRRSGVRARELAAR